jgi:hypothetical protein
MSAYKPKTILVTVGTSPVPLQASAANSLKLGVILQADASNTGNVFVGSSDVTANTGIQLAAGDILSLHAFGTSKGVHEWKLSEIYVVGSAANQKVRVAYAETV